MARIKNYVTDNNITDQDIVVGSDGDNSGVTKNFNVGALKDHILQDSNNTDAEWGSITGDITNQTDLIDELNKKVDKVTGKGLSTNDYTTLEKNKLAGIQDGAEVNVNADWNATSGDAQILNKPTIPAAVTVDSVPTNGSTNAVSSDGVFDALALKADLVAGKVPSSQLPSYVDDVIEGYHSAPTFYSNIGLTTPIVPETGKIYVDLLQNKSYRWSGSVYIQISNAISSIDELTDVTVSSPLNGQLLQYNTTTSQWENQSITVGTGDMQKSTYDIDNDGVVDFAETVPVTVRNPSVSDILRKGTIVYLNGSTGWRPNAYKAQANAEATSSGTFGVVLSDIATNSDGTIATLGTVHTLDTRNAATGATYPFTNDILADGDVLWLDPNNAGYVTKTKPQAPNHIVFIGVVARTHPTLGRIVYRITNGFELDELHNVLINGTLADKHILYYDLASLLWKTNTLAGVLGFTPQELLSSGTNIKTINGVSVLGSGDINTNGTSGNQLLTGGASWSGTGMVYNVTSLTYIIDGTNYGPTTPANVTLSNGDPSFSRFDAIVVDITGIPSVIIGTPSSNPTTPIISEDYVLIQYVLVGAAATTPSITNEFVYREGSSPDWTQAVVPGASPSLSASFVSTTPSPFQGSQSTLITAPSYISSKYIQYTKPLGSILRSTFSFVTFRVNIPVALPTRNVLVSLHNGSNVIGYQYATNWGLNLSTVNTWQLVSIPTSIFGQANITTVTKVMFRFTGVALNTQSAGYDLFAIDDVKFQSGYGPQANTSTITVEANGTSIGNVPKLNFINGLNTSVSSTYDNLNNKVNVGIDVNGIVPLTRQEFSYTSSQDFTLSATPSYIYAVFVNGQELNSSQYSFVTTTLTIADTLESGDKINIVYSETAGGVLDYYTKAQIDAFNYEPNHAEFVEVNTLTDLPSASGGVITLVAGYTYLFLKHIDLLGSRLVCGADTVIVGWSSENCSITSTGLSAATALVTSVYSLPIRNISFTHALVFDLQGDGVTTALDWFGVNLLNCASGGTIKNYTNFVAGDSALLNSGGFTFDGTIGTIAFSNSLFDTASTKTAINILSTCTISRRLRIIYSSFVTLSGETGVNFSTSATVGDEKYILDTCNFSGGGTYTSGFDATSNKSLFSGCIGITNTSTRGFISMINNITYTSTANTALYYKAAGVTTASSLNSKFSTPSDNNLTYTGAFSQAFIIQVNCNVRTSVSTQNINIGIAKNGTFLTESEMTILCAAGSTPSFGATQCVVEMAANDYVELYVRNTSSSNNVMVSDMNFSITKIPV